MNKMLDQDRATVRLWMRRVMDEKDWKASQWAKLAGTTATNITRFLNGSSQHVPSTRTISKLAAVAGYGPDYFNITDNAANKTKALPLISFPAEMQKIIDKRKKNGNDSILTFLVSVRPAWADYKMFVVEITERTFDAAGVMPGDKVVCLPEKERPVEVHAKVIAMTEEGKAGVFYYDPPYLTCQSSAGLAPIKIKGSPFKVLGTAIQVHRDL